MLAPIGFLKGASVVPPFDYAATFGSALFDWWRADVGVNLFMGGPNVQTVIGQHAGTVMGNPDFGGTSYPAYEAASANMGGKPSLRYQDANRRLDTPFGVDLPSPHCLLQVSYMPTWADGNVICNGPLFGMAVKFYSVYRSTQFRIWDGNTADQVVCDAGANWEGVVNASILVMNGASSRVYRNGGANLVASGQTSGGAWNGFVYGTGVFGRQLPAGFEWGETVVLTSIPADAAFNAWLANQVTPFWGRATSPLA